MSLKLKSCLILTMTSDKNKMEHLEIQKDLFNRRIHQIARMIPANGRMPARSATST